MPAPDVSADLVTEDSESNRTLSPYVEGELSNAILTIIVMGTDSNMPIGPQIHPQNTKDRNTTSVERPSLRPMSLGSTTLPNITFHQAITSGN